MFGYIRIEKNELLVRDYEAYKSVYCGLCDAIGREYSFLSRFILSYDCTFYAMLLMSVHKSCDGFERKKCRFNPLKKCSYCKTSSDSLSKAAALGVILAYYKILDDIRDSKFFKRIIYKCVKPFLSHWRKKAAGRYPQLDLLAGNMLKSQLIAEQNPQCGIDMAADPTAVMLAGVLEEEAENEAQRRIYSRIGYGLGRFIYLADAVDDYEEDCKRGRFNPFNSVKENKRQVMKNNLSQSLAMTFEAYNLLDIVDFKGVLDNIILKGLPTVQTEILNKIEVKNERSI